jgi:hypothetical protein
MGGSGGGFFYQGSNNPDDISKRVREQEEKAKDQAFDLEVIEMFKEILAVVNGRDAEQVQAHLRAIENAIVKEIEGTIDLRYGGSVSKHTYVDGLSDIDCLAIINNSELINSSPNEVKEYFFNSIKSRFPNSDIKMGKLAITINYSNGNEIQILPAIKTSSGIKIPSSRREDEWSKIIKPEIFAKTLRFMNGKMAGKLIPVIKLAKSLISSFPENRRLSGYHTECLAIEVFKDYTGIKKTKEMLKYFFNEGARSVLNPIKDKTGQSVHVDDYLNERNSLQRKMTSDSMSSILRKMHNADGSRDVRLWEQILK